MAGTKVNLPLKQAVILAGGQGVRLRPLTLKTPKPMIMFQRRPFLAYIVDQLKANGITEIVMLVGYLHEKIEKYFGNGKKFGIKIKYSYSTVEADTGLRLKNAEKLIDETFLLLYADNYWPLDLKELVARFEASGKPALVTVYANQDGYTNNNIYVDHDGKVLRYDRSRKNGDLNGVDIGFFILNRQILEMLPEGNSSFEDQVLPLLIKRGDLTGYLTDKRYYGLSNLKRLPEIKLFLKPKKTVFLDRDGIINVKPPKAHYVTRWEDFQFLPGVKKGLAKLVRKGFELYLITNQPGVARKLLTQKDLNIIHKKMLRELKKSSIRIKKIYTCIHGWDEGCKCRKPEPGLLLRAALENKINLSESYFIGDDERDVLAGKRAGCKTVYIGHIRDKNQYNLDFEPDIIAESLADSVEIILKHKI